MLDFLEGYLDKISGAATQAVLNGGPLAELSVSLGISVDTVAAQAKDINRLYELTNDLKKKWIPTSSSGTTAGGDMTGNVCPHCTVVGCSAPHKNNACYFDPKKMRDRTEWDCKLMDKKGVACKDDNLRQGTAKTVLHKNSNKEHLSYEASLRCSPTTSYIATPPNQHYGSGLTIYST